MTFNTSHCKPEWKILFYLCFKNILDKKIRKPCTTFETTLG